jgi:S-adenosylhomocysteine hydrolase
MPRTRKKRFCSPSYERTLKEEARLVRELAKNIRGVTEETTTGVHRLYQDAQGRQPALPRDQS